ncbi:subtilisin-like protease 3 [Salvia hispanica]|uniref:subtilisin-like protease 3 n=1 Tax=Salvia hispanica TaxID=49212 RepID=UPI0020092DC2|nr:subtilisin-like protease 3 [Salvia hispanica]
MAFAWCVALICIVYFNQVISANQTTLQTYIVHVESLQLTDLGSFLEAPRILHRYRNVLTGFAAKLSADDLEALRGIKGFISARPEQVYELHTTHSPNFLGLNQNVGFWKGSNYGKGVIIGLLDTGITAGHPSFHDQGVPPPPAKWKGKCQFGPKGCNNKLIGARGFDGRVPADELGHGTHTSGTAGGNFVRGAAIFGNANGTAAGIAPLAHVAMYRVCSPDSCTESSVLAGLEAAIEDGVDVLSLSLGGDSAPFYRDSIAIGAFRATEKGISVVCSAGNSGPDPRSLSNEAPWILTVGASTMDRKLTATVVLGNGVEFDGESAHGFPPTSEAEIFYNNPTLCAEEELKSYGVKGKIVVCDEGLITRISKGEAVKKAGGVGMILINGISPAYTLSAERHVLPASHISYADAIELKSYLNSTKHPKAKIIYKGTQIGKQIQAPAMTSFSSRGPSIASPGILKPDITGPGNNILAAWNASIDDDTTTSGFNMISGTSMSCPHLSGVAALLKSAHPEWSPTAIKSAIMTTADRVDRGGKPISDQRLLPADVFATGAGHVNPTKANDPGLIYDIRPDDYIPYLCGLNFSNAQVGAVVHRRVDCERESSIREAQLNYPSFSIKLGSTAQKYTRTVTNVGRAKSVYKVSVAAPAGVDVKVKPGKLRFKKVGQKLRYSVMFRRSGSGGADNKIVQGEIKWRSGKHSVRSPVAVIFG